jgi:hypothetical protein
MTQFMQRLVVAAWKAYHNQRQAQNSPVDLDGFVKWLKTGMFDDPAEQDGLFR